MSRERPPGEPDEYEKEVDQSSVLLRAGGKRKTVRVGNKVSLTCPDEEFIGKIIRIYTTFFCYLNQKRKRQMTKVGTYIELDTGMVLLADDITYAKIVNNSSE